MKRLPEKLHLGLIWPKSPLILGQQNVSTNTHIPNLIMTPTNFMQQIKISNGDVINLDLQNY